MNKDKFEKSFRLGLGRAYLHVKEHGDDGLQGVILSYCLENPCYDPQCEGSRAEWLMSVINLCSEPNYYTNKIIQELGKTKDDWNISQLYDLCFIIAKQGNKQARKAIYDCFDKQEFNEAYLGGDHIIELDGLHGLLHVARILGRRMLDDPEYWDGMTYQYACELFGKEKTDIYLKERSNEDEAIVAYLKNSTEIYDNCNASKNSPEKISERTRKEIPFHVIQRDIEGVHKHKSRFIRFGKIASNEEIKILYKKMLNEERPAQLERYLWIFRRRELPVLEDKLFELCCSKKKDICSAAITALSHSSYKKVRDFAIKIIKSTKEFPLEIIMLFINNYKNGDATHIERALFESEDTEKAFSLSYYILKVFEKNPDRTMLKCLLWVYDNTPCAHCRLHAVELLFENNILPTDVKQECQFDCNGEIRKIV